MSSRVLTKTCYLWTRNTVHFMNRQYSSSDCEFQSRIRVVKNRYKIVFVILLYGKWHTHFYYILYIVSGESLSAICLHSQVILVRTKYIKRKIIIWWKAFAIFSSSPSSPPPPPPLPPSYRFLFEIKKSGGCYQILHGHINIEYSKFILILL